LLIRRSIVKHRLRAVSNTSTSARAGRKRISPELKSRIGINRAAAWGFFTTRAVRIPLQVLKAAALG
jgi:hypothetical protein